MKLGYIFDMIFFREMHSFHCFLSNEPLRMVEIFSITPKKRDTVVANANDLS